MFTTARLHASLTFWTVADRFRCSPKSMDIGGTDVSFELDGPVTLDRLQRVITELWPEAVFETDGQELFAYRDEDAFESWNAYGLTEDNGGTLLYATVDGTWVHLVHDDAELAAKFIGQFSEVTCDGSCDPMCAWCHRQADLAAENRFG